MKIIEGEAFVYFDVDDTLVKWNLPIPEEAIMFTSPDDPSDIWALTPNWPVILKLKEHKRNGDTVIVWSQGGWAWAKEVVTVLKLESYVDAILSKPHKFYDDVPALKFMNNWVKV